MNRQRKPKPFIPPPAVVWGAALFAIPIALLLIIAAVDWVRRPTAAIIEPSRPNILVILWDTVRADRLDCYGYDKTTTPNIDRFAAEAALFEYAISPSPWTVPAHASMFTGLFPSAHGANRASKWLGDGFVTLAETLRSHGYATYMFSANPFVSHELNLTQGFETAEFPWDEKWKAAVDADFRARTGGHMKPPSKSGRDRAFKDAGAIVNRAFLEWLDARDAGKPFFAFLNYMEAHAPLAPSLDERTRFLDPETAERSFGLPQSFTVRWAHSFGVQNYSDQAIRVYNALYDAVLYRLDTLAGELLDALDRRRLRENTAIILVADHGENLNDHHLLGHEYCVYNTLLRVPLMIRYPARFPAGRVAHPVQSIDLYPTILELAGVPPPDPEQVQGVSLLRQVESPLGDRPLISEYLTPPDLGVNLVTARFPDRFPKTEHAKWKRRLWSIELDGYKYIRAEDGAHELYDLKSDPGERNNLIDREPARAARLRARLDAWLASFEPLDPAARPPGDSARRTVTDGPPPEGLSPDVAERLESLGYIHPGPVVATQPVGTPGPPHE